MPVRDEPVLDLVPADVLRAMDCLGLRVLGPVGSHGAAWLGEDTDGARSELHVVAAVVDDQVAARADALRAVRHDDLARVHDVLEIGPGRLALVVEHVPGPTLGELRASRAPLSDAEAAGVAIRLADALEALHAAGTAHGSVGTEQVVVRADGRPVLVDLAACLVGSGSPAGDVGRLVATVLAVMPDEDAHLLGASADGAPSDPHDGTVGGSLRDALVALVRDPAPAAAVAVTCLSVVRPEPLRLPDAALLAGSTLASWCVAGDERAPSADAGSGPAARSRGDAPRTSRGAASAGRDRLPARRRPGAAGARPRRRRALLAVAATVAAAVVVVAVGWGLVSRGSGVATSASGVGSPSPTVAGQDADRPTRQGAEEASGQADEQADEAGDGPDETPEEAAAALTARRAQVVAAGDPAGLGGVEVVDGPAYAADVALLTSLSGTTFEDYQVEVQDAVLLDEASASATDEARVQVTSSASAHVRVGPGGRTPVPATEPSAVVLVLRSTDDGWRVWDVEAAA